MDPKAQPEPLTRRVLVHRRRTPARRLKAAVTFTLSAAVVAFVAVAIVLDAVLPRALSDETVARFAASLGSQNSVADARALLEAADIATTHAIAAIPETTIVANPPLLVTRTLLYWTPVESLTLIQYPPTTVPSVHPGAPVTQTLYPLSAAISITPISASKQSQSSPIYVPRFTAFSLRATDAAAMLEHANGFLPARAAMHAVYASFITVDYRHLWRAFTQTTSHSTSYAARCLSPSSFPSLSAIFLAAPRRIASTVQARRHRKASSNAAPTTATTSHAS